MEVSNKMGIHARPAAMIVRIASRYEGEVWVTKEAERVNAKSIMGIMMLAAAKGTQLKFEASGAKLENLEKEMTRLFASKFQDEYQKITKRRQERPSRGQIGHPFVVEIFLALIDLRRSVHLLNRCQ